MLDSVRIDGEEGKPGGLRTVGSGFVRKRWSVRRMSSEDLPTAASPVEFDG